MPNDKSMTFHVQAGVLMRAVDAVKHAVSKDVTRARLTKIRIGGVKDNASLVVEATDTHRCAQVALPVECGDHEFGYLMDADFIKALADVAKPAGKPVEIVIRRHEYDSAARFACGDRTVERDMECADFPMTHKVFGTISGQPLGNKPRLTWSAVSVTPDWLSVAERMMAITDHKVVVNISGSEAIFTAESKEGRATDVLPIVEDLDVLVEFGVCAPYWRDALRTALTFGPTTLTVSDSAREPFLLTAGEYREIIMPMIIR